MNKLDTYIEELLIFMKNEIEDKALPLNATTFNFSLSTTEQYFNADDETFPNGDDLIAFQKVVNITDNTIFEQIFSKARNEGYIKNAYISGKSNEAVQLTDNGLRMAKAIHINRKSAPKKAISKITDKLIYPVVAAVISAIVISVVMSYFQDKKVEQMSKDIKQLQKDMKWMKQKR
jgi:hypothetical protein